MSNLVESITINVPAGQAFGQWSRLHTLPRFMGGAPSADSPNGRTHWTTDIGGITKEFDAEILTTESDRKVAWQSVRGPRHCGSVEFEPIGDSSTRLTAQLDIDPEGFAEAAAEGLGLLDVRLKRDLERFKDFMEFSKEQ